MSITVKFWLEVVPSVRGLATIYDKDILIYCISQMIAKITNGGTGLRQRVRICALDFLVFTNRGTGGKDYKALCESLDRLDGTRIRTNIQTGDEEQFDTFGLIDASSLRRKNGLDGRLLWCEVKLSDWVFNAIRAQEVLTLHPDYFRLRKPLERRVYELARKHCGQQPQWTISLEKLLKKTGSQSPMKRFRQMIKGLADYDHLPDYRVELRGENALFINRNAASRPEPYTKESGPVLQSTTYHEARKAAPGYDVYYLEGEWRHFWVDSGKPEMKSPDKAFIGFCRRRYERNPNP